MSLEIRVSQVGEHISLGICVSPGGGTHRDTCFLGGEHISLGIRVSQEEEHVSLGICFSPDRGTHITRDTSFPGRGRHITMDMCFPRWGNTYH